MTSLDDQLKEAKAKLDAKIMSRADVAKQRELDKTLRALADEEVIATLEDAHGIENIRIVDTDRGAIVVGRPDLGEYKRITDKAPDISLALASAYAKSCVLHPAKDEVAKLMSEHPALAWPIMRAANSIAAADAEVREAK